VTVPFEWGSLRTWRGLQQLAFEELCCQLADAEDIPSGSKFIRKGAPDAGVECFWKLINGDEYGWQAKYFRKAEEIDWGQMDDSVQTAIEKHPKLIQYTFCLPMDRPDARVDGQRSCLDKWNERVEKWRELANKNGMQLDFQYWGEHEIGDRLSQERHRGRLLFWFNKDLLSQENVTNKISDTIANVGPRYTPDFNIELEIAEIFEAVGRTEKFQHGIRKNLGNLRRRLEELARQKPESSFDTAVNSLINTTDRLVGILEKLGRCPVASIDLGEAKNLFNQVRDASFECERTISIAKEAEIKSKSGKEEVNLRYARSEKHDHWSYQVRQVRDAVYECHRFIIGNEAALALVPAMILAGEAGSGKTHLLCDIAKRRSELGLPTALLLGENFNDTDPWQQIITKLDLNCQTKEELLGIFNAAGEAAGTRALIIIDAINESRCKEMWKRQLGGILHAVSRYKWVGIVLSVRTTYLKYLVPEDLSKEEKVTIVIHGGFRGVEYRAATAFFDHYGIQHPSVPFLNPEFQNPQFLKVLCKGMKNLGMKSLPRGFHGITRVYELYLESVNKQISQSDKLDCDPARNVVKLATNEIVKEMCETGRTWVERVKAKDLVNAIFPSNGYEQSLFRYLETEGIIYEDLVWNEAESIEVIRFAYERFSDHLVVRYLLEQSEDIEKAFEENKPLGAMFKDYESCWTKRGLVDAIAIQIPEYIGKELVELVPKARNWDQFQQGFLESLIWRKPEAITDATKKYFEQVAKNPKVQNEILETLLTVAVIEEHPFNADSLHERLMKKPLPKRDASWSIAIFYEYGEKGALDRIVDWAWSSEDKSNINDKSILLCAKTLAWFFTTSQRFLRDGATKAAVNLLTNRLHLIRPLLEAFENVDDPYVKERLYAVAYGSAMRSRKTESIKDLASYIYEKVFKDSTPPPDVLLRDYARGVIELALRYGAKMDIDKKKIRPPYRSEWPKDIPKKDELEAKYSYEATEQRGRKIDKYIRRLYSDIASSGFSDFNRYILNRIDWTSRRKGEPRKITKKERYETFIKCLNEDQRRAWDVFSTHRVQAIHITFLGLDRESSEETDTEGKQKALDEAEKQFRETLDGAKMKEYEDFVVPYLSRPISYDDEERFEKSIMEAFIFKRVLDLGWNPKLHGEFDERRDDFYRNENKPERIGKKYQWIAYHELIARLCDNFEYRKDYWSEVDKYEGPWQDYSRDIDPSYVLRGTKTEHWASSHTRTWWFPVSYNHWDDIPSNINWLKENITLPKAESMIDVSKDDGSSWLTLEGFYYLMEPIPPEEETYEKKRKNIWYMVKSYLVKKRELDVLFDWMKGKNLFGRWMPESHSNIQVFIGEFFWAPAFKFHERPYYHHDGWTKGGRGNESLPVEVMVTTDQYLKEGGGYDCSIADSVSIYLPTRQIVEAMQLSGNGCEGYWYDKDGKLQALDPSVKEQGQGALLIRKESFEEFLEKYGYAVLWTVLGEKSTVGGGYGREEYEGRLIINTVGKLENGKIVTSTNHIFEEGGSR